MSVTLHGLDEFLADLRGFAADVDELPELEQVGGLVADSYRAGAPRRTGELAGSVEVKVSEDTVSVFASADHAAPIIVGVPSHNIEPHPFPEAALVTREADVLAGLEDGVEAAIRRRGLN